jgi:EmrB/QacA subfamily drug resistance transporter
MTGGVTDIARRHRPRYDAALLLILTVAFMVVLDFSIVNVALASMERELHVGATAVQWVITAYAIAFGGLLVLGGRIGDLFGRRRMFVAGLLVFSAASLAGGLAGTIQLLVAARAVQGLGAALVAPAALSLITTSIPEGPARTRALGYYGATASVGFVAGLVLGGLLVQFFDWRAVLWVNVPIGLAAAVLAPVLLPASRPAGPRRRLDLTGALLVTAGVAACVYALSQGPVRGWVSAQFLVALALSGALLSAFVAVELHHPSPLVRLGILRRRSLRTASLVTVMIGASSAGELLVIPLYMQLVLHYSPLLTGLAIAPQGVFGFLGSARGSLLVKRAGVTRFLLLTEISAALGLSLLGVFLAARSYPLLLAGFALTGFGTSAGAFGATVVATVGVSDGEQGFVGGLVNMSRQVGAAFGVAVAAAIIGVGASSGTSLVADRNAVFAAAGAVLVASLVVLRMLTSGSRQGAKLVDLLRSPAERSGSDAAA